MHYLGLSAFCHHSSAAILGPDGTVIAAVEEERFTRKKREGRFPRESILHCLHAAQIDTRDLAGVALGWGRTDFLLQRLLRSNLLEYPVGLKTLKETFQQYRQIAGVRDFVEQEVGPLSAQCVVTTYRHHLAHAASAYFASPFDEAAFLTVDGRGEREAFTWGLGRGAHLEGLGARHFPHSLGKLYSALCRYLGFAKPEKDGTVMALAAYGKPSLAKPFAELASWDVRGEVGTLRLNTKYFDFEDVALPSPRMEELFGIPARAEGAELTDFHRDLAATLQQFTENVLISLARSIHKTTHQKRLVMAGGVALNTVANGRILEESGFADVFVQPAAYDGGLSLGAGLLLVAQAHGCRPQWTMHSAALGPDFTDAEIRSALTEWPDLIVEAVGDPAAETAQRLAAGEIVGWFQGKLEFGPRALGQRCLLADPRNETLKQRLNKIKGRESFRPFASAILAEKATEWLVRGSHSPFMLLVDHIQAPLRSRVPGVLHFDNSVRVQTVEEHVLPLFHRVLHTFHRLTSVPLLVSTSLNIRGEPLACTPGDAARVLVESEIDALIIGALIVTRRRSKNFLGSDKVAMHLSEKLEPHY